jgi:hypothetical protein
MAPNPGAPGATSIWKRLGQRSPEAKGGSTDLLESQLWNSGFLNHKTINSAVLSQNCLMIHIKQENHSLFYKHGRPKSQTCLGADDKPVLPLALDTARVWRPGHLLPLGQKLPSAPRDPLICPPPCASERAWLKAVIQEFPILPRTLTRKIIYQIFYSWEDIQVCTCQDCFLWASLYNSLPHLKAQRMWYKMTLFPL